jgi:hypothetical protein
MSNFRRPLPRDPTFAFARHACEDHERLLPGPNRCLSLRSDEVERHTHDYRHSATTDLYAALDRATGKLTAKIDRRHRDQSLDTRDERARSRRCRAGAGRGPVENPLSAWFMEAT